LTYLRRLPRFEYLAPGTIGEACDILAQQGHEARLLAGGTDLVLQMRRREVVPRYVVGLKGIPELAFIRSNGDGSLAIGAMTTTWAIQSSPLILREYDFLAQTALELGTLEVRNVATVGGNICGALPCADFPPPLITLGARVKLVSKKGERVISLEDFFLDLEQTAMEPQELLTEIQIPPLPAFSGGAYIKFHDRHAVDITTVGAGAFLTVDPEGKVCRDVSIALATSAPTPLRAKGAEAALRGQPLTEDALEEVARLTCEEARPRTSWRATREFRQELIRALTKRALRQAWEKARAAASSQAR